MCDKRTLSTNPDQPMVYQLRLHGHLSLQRSEWFGALTILLQENGDTLLTGLVADQAALFGLLRKVRDSGLPLIALNLLESDDETDPHERT